MWLLSRKPRGVESNSNAIHSRIIGFVHYMALILLPSLNWAKQFSKLRSVFNSLQHK